jgi:hypothetical protein
MENSKTIIFQPVLSKKTRLVNQLSENLPQQTINNNDIEQFAHNNIKTNKERTKRIITETKKWVFTKEEIEYNNQLLLLSSFKLVYIKENNNKQIKNNIHQIIYSQIKAKLRSYKEQDIKKNKYDPLGFVTIDFILYKLQESAMICFYCKQPTNILYEYVREPKQWTLERLNNEFGHNCNNVEIACLSCNLRRRTMYFERYLTTKRICQGIIKVGEDEINPSLTL